MESNVDWWLLSMAVFIVAILTVPHWRYSRTWGYSLFGILAVIFFILVVLIAFGIVPPRW